MSSAAYALIAAFTASHAYNIGDIVTPSAPALKAKWAFRCTTAGTSSTEPTWPTANNATVTTGGATFTNVTGQSAYFWSAAAGDIPTICNTNNRLSGGDRVFVSSDHSESQTAASNYGTGTSGPSSFSPIQIISVNRGGSTPPVAADVTSGATVTSSANIIFMTDSPCFYNGITFAYSGGGAFGLSSNNSGTDYQAQVFKNCQLNLTDASGTASVLTAQVPSKIVLDNTPISFATVGQSINGGSGTLLDLTWQNTASAVAGTAPTTLFTATNAGPLLLTARGVDLSAETGTLAKATGGGGSKYLFDSCKIASGVTRYNTAGVTNSIDELDFVNCFDGTHILSERYQVAGTLTTDRSTTLVGGAQDDTGLFSHKLVSTANVDDFSNTFNSFWMDVENTLTGSSHTATVEIVSSGTLNNNDISLTLEYLGTSGSSLASFASSFIATPLTTPSAVPSSSVTWNNPPATPQKQHLQVTFTPQQAGRLRGQVKLGKASTTVWINPQIAVT